MAFKKNILKKYTHEDEILYIVWHDPWEYIKLMLKYLIIILITFTLYSFTTGFIIKWFVVNWIFWIVWLIIYYKFIIDFMDTYLDAIIVTPTWITIFRWDWLVNYSSENLNWHSIQSIYDDQNWLMDITLNKWDIKIKTHWDIYTFKNVSWPVIHKNKIISIQEKIREGITEEPELDKFDILVEALWEVIIDYMKKWKHAS